MKVYIGVGHGGKDSGAVGYLVEKDINLKMALACADYLKTKGVNVKLSRTNDSYKSVSTKAKEANLYQCDIAIDVHNNAGGGKGFEAIHSLAGGKGKELAKLIEKEVIAIGQNSRGLITKKNASGKDYYGFIRSTKMPALILEGVFVDNKEDVKLADTDEKCKKFGEAYAKGILKYFGVSDVPYLIKVIKPAPIYKNDLKTMKDKCFQGVYTIIEEKNGFGLLKSKAGWIKLNTVTRV